MRFAQAPARQLAARADPAPRREPLARRLGPAREAGRALPSDPHCFPSLSKTRVWHWNGTRITATRWAVSPQTTLPQFLSPDRKIWCSLTDLVAVRRVWCGIEG